VNGVKWLDPGQLSFSVLIGTDITLNFYLQALMKLSAIPLGRDRYAVASRQCNIIDTVPFPAHPARAGRGTFRSSIHHRNKSLRDTAASQNTILLLHLVNDFCYNAHPFVVSFPLMFLKKKDDEREEI
jgi:hypothetical protein